MLTGLAEQFRTVGQIAIGLPLLDLSPLDLAIPELGGGASSGGASAEGNDGQAGASPQRSPTPSTGTPAGAVGSALGRTERAARRDGPTPGGGLGLRPPNAGPQARLKAEARDEWRL